LTAGALSSVGVALTLARAVVRAVGALARKPEVWLLAHARARFRDTRTVAIASVAAHERVVDAVTVRALAGLAGAVELDSIGSHTPEGSGNAVALADATLLVDDATVRALIINRAIHVEVVGTIRLILGWWRMAVLALVRGSVVVVGVAVALANRVVTALATDLTGAAVAAHTLGIMLVEPLPIAWAHPELAGLAVEADVARAPLLPRG